MAIRPNGFKTVPKAPATRSRSTGGEGGTPRGWTFISTGFTCWRRWLFAYVIQLVGVETAEALLVGSAYHALLEGDSPDEVLKRFPKQIEQALGMFKARMEKGPPIPEAESVEKQVAIHGGQMTSKPDRVEVINGKRLIRDYKSTMLYSEYDEMKWQVDGGIIGEMVAAGADEGIVDIQRKWDPSTSSNNTKLVRVHLTPAKTRALAAMVKHFWMEVAIRMEWGTPDAFPRNLLSCVGKYGPCPYYARCWGSPPESLLYQKRSGVPAWAADAPKKEQERIAQVAKATDSALRKDPTL